MSHSRITTSPIRIACASLALLVGASAASPALAGWQPRATVPAQATVATPPTGDWQPRRATAGVLTSARHERLNRSPRAAVAEAASQFPPSEPASNAWQPRSAMPLVPGAQRPASPDWTPRASLKPAAIVVAAPSRKHRERLAPQAGAASGPLAASSAGY